MTVAPLRASGLEKEGGAVGPPCPSSLEKGQEDCQETCAMSLTRFWMSWRHSGHVSNCKAHSIHIPLEEEWGGGTKGDFNNQP